MLIVRLLAVLAAFGFCFAHAAEPGSFPVTLKGKTLTITTATGRETLAARIKEALPGEEPSILSPERIQYDFIAVKGEGPVMFLADFDKRGGWTQIVIESNMKQQNPVARELLDWLAANAGKGRKIGKETVWSKDGLTFRFQEVKNAGEDSVYGITITRK